MCTALCQQVANDRQARQARLQELEAKAEAIMRKMGARGKAGLGTITCKHACTQQGAPGSAQDAC